ncbi:ribulose 1,5-bisphosphate carboxylase [candidate division MSBL1 archaeon SCGC-AAA261G05]|uniref:Ribulose bisphosphate carboxylase n=2 Tax=candidate division MSBL1 TaxID=215777 RepID=A0A133VBJ2_9EURY|nr:ribulose 1,5-bisphosphate carboxylase [candidate division MSBL1 archaeon SCGC-AAA261O19]KXB03823.1 ribulose 1,5-bisphosphate carboxylase [candidate division MSBL1 archaeon SCGC-AAA261G05]
MRGMRYEDYLEESYEPQETDLVCEFRFEHDPSVSFEWAAGAIGAESSIGTWDPHLSTMREEIRELGAKVFWTDKEDNRVKIAYPQDLFEPRNMPQILSSITGNIFGLSELTRLKLLDVNFPEEIINGFSGPQLGISGVRELTGIKDRPLLGTIVKPKLGLSDEQHSTVAYDAWRGGVEIVKDDENLADMSFNRFEDRIPKTLDKRDEAEDETGEKKLYFPNITAPLSEMKRRADLVIDHGGEYVMIDILTTGWSALQEMRDYLEGKGIGIHAHRAQHAAYTRLEDHGISMLAIAKFARLVGVDNLHAGTIVGKMEGEKQEILNIYDSLRSNFHDLKRTIPVASGGLHPGLVDDLIDIFGTDLVTQAGGGIHGHPDGTESGARAMRQAVEARTQGIELQDYAEDHPELAKALEKWD